MKNISKKVVRHFIIDGKKVNYKEIESYYRNSIIISFKDVFTQVQLTAMMINALGQLLLKSVYKTELEVSDYLFRLLFDECNRIKKNVAVKQIMNLQSCYTHFYALSIDVKKAISLTNDIKVYPTALTELDKYQRELSKQGNEYAAKFIGEIYSACEKKFISLSKKQNDTPDITKFTMLVLCIFLFCSVKGQAPMRFDRAAKNGKYDSVLYKPLNGFAVIHIYSDNMDSLSIEALTTNAKFAAASVASQLREEGRLILDRCIIIACHINHWHFISAIKLTEEQGGGSYGIGIADVPESFFRLY